MKTDRYYIGGGNIAGILGLSPYRTPLQEYETILGIAEPPSQEKLRFLSRRKALEPLALDFFTEETGIQIEHHNRRLVHPEYDFIRAELDAETSEGDTVEIKTVHPYAAHDWMDNDVPEYVRAQAMHGLMVSGRQHAYVLGLVGFDDLHISIINRDQRIIDMLKKTETAFWREHILPQAPPAPISIEDAKRQWPNDSGATAIASTAIENLCIELAQYKAQIKDLEKRFEDGKLEIMLGMADASKLISYREGKVLATWRANAVNRVDLKQLQAKHQNIAEQCTVTTSERRLLLK